MLREGNSFLSTFHLSFSRSLCIYLSHHSLYKETAWLFTCHTLMPHHFFTSLSPFCILSAKKAKCLFLLVPMFNFFHFLKFINSHHKAGKCMCTLCTYFPPQGSFDFPSWQLKTHLSCRYPSGGWLDGPVTTLLARETEINILPLFCPYSSIDEHDGAGEEERRWGVGA